MPANKIHRFYLNPDGELRLIKKILPDGVIVAYKVSSGTIHSLTKLGKTVLHLEGKFPEVHDYGKIEFKD